MGSSWRELGANLEHQKSEGETEFWHLLEEVSPKHLLLTKGKWCMVEKHSRHSASSMWSMTVTSGKTWGHHVSMIEGPEKGHAISSVFPHIHHLNLCMRKISDKPKLRKILWNTWRVFLKNVMVGTSLVAQWLRLFPSNARGLGFDLWSWRKILHAVQHHQKVF